MTHIPSTHCDRMTQVQHERMFASEKPLEIVDGATVHVFNDLAALSRTALRYPCVVIAGDSLCFGKGPLAWCLQHLYNPSRPNNCIIITGKNTAKTENPPPMVRQSNDGHINIHIH